MTAERRTLRDGLVVGLIAYAAVALFYSAFDLLAARGTLYTVDLLGKALFRGLRDASVLQFPVARDTSAILLYNAFHLVMSLAIGILVTALVGRAERRPSQAGAILLAIVAGGIVTIFVVGYLTESVRPLLPFWSIVVANATATMLAGLYLAARRPGLLQRLAPLAAARR